MHFEQLMVDCSTLVTAISMTKEHFDADYNLHYYWNPETGDSMWDRSGASVGYMHPAHPWQLTLASAQPEAQLNRGSAKKRSSCAEMEQRSHRGNIRWIPQHLQMVSTSVRWFLFCTGTGGRPLAGKKHKTCFANGCFPKWGCMTHTNKNKFYSEYSRKFWVPGSPKNDGFGH